jgi:hypothetical protein
MLLTSVESLSIVAKDDYIQELIFKFDKNVAFL